MDGHNPSQAGKVGDAPSRPGLGRDNDFEPAILLRDLAPRGHRRVRERALGAINKHPPVLAGPGERFVDARAGCQVVFGDDRCALVRVDLVFDLGWCAA
jgi:hypothetical protein